MPRLQAGPTVVHDASTTCRDHASAAGRHFNIYRQYQRGSPGRMTKIHYAADRRSPLQERQAAVLVRFTLCRHGLAGGRGQCRQAPHHASRGKALPTTRSTRQRGNRPRSISPLADHGKLMHRQSVKPPKQRQSPLKQQRFPQGSLPCGQQPPAGWGARPEGHWQTPFWHSVSPSQSQSPKHLPPCPYRHAFREPKQKVLPLRLQKRAAPP
jgi:hypothetical protein